MSLKNKYNHTVVLRVLLCGAMTTVWFFVLGVMTAAAATLSLAPGTGVYTAGQTFTVSVLVNTTGAAINAAEGTLTFNTSELSVVGISKGSIFSLWTAEPSFSNTAGTVSFSGGSPSGYTGGNGTILNITFRSKGSGSSKVSFSSGSVLAADGRGTNVLTSMSSGAYTIASAEVAPEPEVIEYVAPANTPGTPQITSTTHADAASWYPEKTASLQWTLPSDVTAVRTLLDGNSGSIPTRVYDSPISSITLEDLEEGVQYFHLQFKNAEGWGRVAHYRLAVDTEQPTDFDITLTEGADLSNPIQTLMLHASDTASYVQRFLIQVDGSEPYEFIDEAASGTVALPALEPGHHTIIIEAFDAAGNSIIDTLAFAILAFDKPQFTEYPSEISEDVIPVFKGITRPNATITIFMEHPFQEEGYYEYTVVADESGEFIFIPESRFVSATYKITAVAVDEYGAQSELSDAISFAVQKPGYVRVGNIALSILSIIVPLIALLLLLVLTVVFFFARIKKVRRVVTAETNEALSILEREFAKLFKALRASKDDLEKSRKTKKLTKAEERLIEEMEMTLTNAKASIKKEIADVDDIVT